MGIIVWAVVLLASLWVLVKAADHFTDYAEKFGKFLKLPNFIIGVLILAIGTSLPELVTSIMGVRQGDTEFLSGNVLGTVIVNMLLGLGIAVLFTKRKAIFNWNIIDNDLPFFAASIFLVSIALMDGKFSTVEAVLFLAGYIVYVIYAYFVQRSDTPSAKKELKKQLKKEISTDIEQAKTGAWLKKIFTHEFKTLLYMLLALGVVVVASHYVVEAVMNLALLLGLGTSILAATAVALGTSLPEILVAVSAARRGNFDMVMGDILGSNIFDIFVIYGVTGLFTTLTITTTLYSILIPFLIGTFFLLWLVLIDKKITKMEAVMFLIIYVMFVGKLFGMF
jgi:cation:H+ antiporter